MFNIDADKVFDYVGKNVEFVRSSFYDFLSFFSQKRTFFDRLFQKSFGDVLKELSLYIALIILVIYLIEDGATSAVKSIATYVITSLSTDLLPILISVRLMYLLTDKYWSFKDEVAKVFLFLIYNYIFIGSIITLYDQTLYTTDNYKRDQFIINSLGVVFFCIKHVFSGRVFFDKRWHSVLFAIVNMLVFNVIFVVYMISYLLSAEGKVPVVMINKIKISNNDYLSEWNKYTYKSGDLNSDKFPFAVEEFVTKDNKYSSVYAFSNSIHQLDTTLVYSENYSLTVDLLEKSKRQIDSLNSYLKEIEYSGNVKFFTKKRDIYQLILDGIDKSELRRDEIESKRDEIKLIKIKPTLELVVRVQEFKVLEKDFKRNNNIAYKPIFLLYKIYFAIGERMLSIFYRVGESDDVIEYL